LARNSWQKSILKNRNHQQKRIVIRTNITIKYNNDYFVLLIHIMVHQCKKVNKPDASCEHLNDIATFNQITVT
jgi:hypothetical protein